MNAHLKGHYTTNRLQKARVVEAVEPCPFCREHEDSVKHFFVRGTVRSALAEVAADAAMTPPEWDIADMFMQRYRSGYRRGLLLDCFAAVMSARQLARRSFDLRDPAELARRIGREIECPWLAACSATLSKKERRRMRVAHMPPIRHRYITASMELAGGKAEEARAKQGGARRCGKQGAAATVRRSLPVQGTSARACLNNVSE